MAMTRKTYRTVAVILRELDLEPEKRSKAIQEFGRMFKADNSRFSWDRFESAVIEGE